MDHEITTAEEASAVAVHKSASAAQAREAARELQLAELAEKTAEATKLSLIEGLKEVFGDSDSDNPQQMKVLVRRIPILCTTITNMERRLTEMQDSQKWAVRIIVGLFIAAVAKVIFIN